MIFDEKVMIWLPEDGVQTGALHGSINKIAP